MPLRAALRHGPQARSGLSVPDPRAEGTSAFLSQGQWPICPRKQVQLVKICKSLVGRSKVAPK